MLKKAINERKWQEIEENAIKCKKKPAMLK